MAITCQMCPQSSPGRDTSFKEDAFKDFENLDKITPHMANPLLVFRSGEATMAKDLAEYIKLKKRDLDVSFILMVRDHGDYEIIKTLE